MLLPPALGFSPLPPVSVSGTGPHKAIAAFLGSQLAVFPTLSSVRITLSGPPGGFSSQTPPSLTPGFPLPAPVRSPRPCSSVCAGCRNLYLLSIDYASQPRLRSRLTQGRSALPWKPWIFGREDSHLSLATHSGILSSCLSTAPSGAASPLAGLLLYRSLYNDPRASVACFSPGTFSAQDLSASELLRTL